MNYLILIPFFILSAAFHQPLYFLIPMGVGVYFYSTKNYHILNNSFNRTYISTFFIIFLFFLIQSVYNLKIEWHSLKGLFRYLAYALFALFVFKLPLKETTRYFKIVAVLLIILLPFTFMLIDDSGGYRGIFRHSNHLGYVLAITIYFLFIHKPFKFIVNTFVIICLTLLLFYTKTSGAILILVLLILYNFVVSPKMKLKYKLFFIFGPLLLIIPLAYQFSDKIIEQIDSLEYLQKEFILKRVYDQNPGGYGSFIWRIVYWLQIYFEFLKESLISRFFGVGIDALTKGNMPYKFMYTDPHNDFLKVLVEFGYVGLFLFLNFLKNIFFLLNKNINILILLIIPLLFDNAIVNFSFNISMILLIAYEYKKLHTDISN